MLGKDEVLFLYPEVKVEVLEISACLAAWIRITLELLEIHFFRKKMGYFQCSLNWGLPKSSQKSHQDIRRKTWESQGDIGKHAIFFAVQTVAQHNEPWRIL